MRMMIMQTSERDVRADEWRREEREREDRKELRTEKDEIQRLLREEKREGTKRNPLLLLQLSLKSNSLPIIHHSHDH
jgi:hypothetical protein